MAFLKKSIETFVAQVNAAAPNRSKASDGGAPSAEHMAQNPKSDHNTGHAYDITHDPAHGVDCNRIAAELVASQDPRIKYVIWNSRICSSKVSPWVWRPYSGDNPHDKHLHLSVMTDDAALYDDPKPWAIFGGAAQPAAKPGVFTGITATVFGGPSDLMSGEQTAYGARVAPGWWDRPGVALPARLSQRPLPQVRVTHNGRSVVCPVIDVGPWNTRDPYWETGARPQAESGTDMTRRKTNRAGIDLTPAAAQAIGLPGKGLVDWEFVNPQTQDKPMTDPQATPPSLENLDEIMRALQIIDRYGPALDWLLRLRAAQQTQQPSPLPAPKPVEPIVEPVPELEPPPASPPLTERPSVQLGVLGLLATTVAQVLGVVGPPIGETSTTTGQLLPILSLGTAALGATGAFAPFARIAGAVLGALTQSRTQPK